MAKGIRGDRWMSHSRGREQSRGAAVAAKEGRRDAREQETSRRMTAWTARRARVASGARAVPSRVRTRMTRTRDQGREGLMARKPYTWSRKPTPARRTYRAVKDSARDRATIAKRRALAKLKGHKHSCPDCGKSSRTDFGRDTHKLKHQREKDAKARTQGKGRNTGRAKPVGSAFGKPVKRPTRGKHVDLSTGKRFRNHLDLNKD